MPIQVEWADANRTVIHYHFPQQWTWDEFHASNQTTRLLMISVEHPVDVIYEMDAAMILPPRVLHNMTRTLREQPPTNFNRVVLIGTNGLVRNLVGVLRTLYPAQMSRLAEAQTVEHALRLLDRKAQTGRLV